MLFSGAGGRSWRAQAAADLSHVYICVLWLSLCMRDWVGGWVLVWVSGWVFVWVGMCVGVGACMCVCVCVGGGFTGGVWK